MAKGWYWGNEQLKVNVNYSHSLSHRFHSVILDRVLVIERTSMSSSWISDSRPTLSVSSRQTHTILQYLGTSGSSGERWHQATNKRNTPWTGPSPCGQHHYTATMYGQTEQVPGRLKLFAQLKAGICWLPATLKLTIKNLSWRWGTFSLNTSGQTLLEL